MGLHRRQRGSAGRCSRQAGSPSLNGSIAVRPFHAGHRLSFFGLIPRPLLRDYLAPGFDPMHTLPFEPIRCPQRSRLPQWAAAALVLFAAFLHGSVIAAAAPTAVPRIPAGTSVAAATANRFNRVIYQAVSRITAGDADRVPSAIRGRVSMFTFAMLATVAHAGDSAGYRLVEVGVGYAVPLGGQLTVVDTEAPPAAAGIDRLGRQVLSANGRNLGSLRLVGKNDLMQVIDIDALVRVGSRHAPLTMRHFIWADPASGRVASCIWLLQKRNTGTYAPLGTPPRWLHEGTHDNRSIHVDASKFILGLPTQEAFAISSLPPGSELTWTTALQQVAALPIYSDANLQQLTAAISEALTNPPDATTQASTAGTD
jgi:hypothetical protein